jgi:hypothetical protein
MKCRRLGNCEDEWVPTDAQAERLLADMRADRLVEIIRDGLGEREKVMSETAPAYMRADNERQIKAHVALDEIEKRLLA